MQTFTPYLLVFVGAGLGGMLRHGLGVAFARALGTAFPFGTMIINVSGSLAMGLLAGGLAARAGQGWAPPVRLFIGTGLLGGYTTFSTFSLETVLLLERGQGLQALAYVAASVAFGAIGLWAGLVAARSLA